ncbi:hypothetical protein NL676_024095 [Syzygium grande]|nr:hypothetical protein NL676_024095 [Syzygium grande]
MGRSRVNPLRFCLGLPLALGKKLDAPPVDMGSPAFPITNERSDPRNRNENASWNWVARRVLIREALHPCLHMVVTKRCLRFVSLKRLDVLSRAEHLISAGIRNTHHVAFDALKPISPLGHPSLPASS